MSTSSSSSATTPSSDVLLGVASQPLLQGTLVFKGGTALKKIYFESYRFSEDLDFSSVRAPTGAALEQAISAAVSIAQAAARVFAPITMTVERYEERAPHPGGQEAFVLRVQFPWQRQPMVPIKIEVTHDELVLLPTPAMPVLHAYGEPMQMRRRCMRAERDTTSEPCVPVSASP